MTQVHHSVFDQGFFMEPLRTVGPGGATGQQISPASRSTWPARTPIRYAVYDSPLGELLLLGDGDALTGLHFADGSKGLAADPAWCRDDRAFTSVRRELDAYFGRELTTFSVPLAPHGTPFQLRVWDALRHIPYSATTSYGQLAAKLGSDKLSRAVGLANGSNPIAIIIPCHRVIGANGRLTGYGGGIHRKHWLLAHEGLALPLV